MTCPRYLLLCGMIKHAEIIVIEFKSRNDAINQKKLDFGDNIIKLFFSLKLVDSMAKIVLSWTVLVNIKNSLKNLT